MKKNKLKDYILYLLTILILIESDKDIDSIIIDYQSIFKENLLTLKKFKFFIFKYKKIKVFIKTKHSLVLYNKIYKILFDFKNIKNGDFNIYFNLELKDLHKENLFLYLPYKLELKYILKKKK